MTTEKISAYTKIEQSSQKLFSFVELIGCEAVCPVAKTSHLPRLTSTPSVAEKETGLIQYLKQVTASFVLDNKEAIKR